ncbi:hypothetical protein AJ79_09822 [Helicocarpus griseus UAMH5409]|uniref:Uncharacterized protein n=1 Tax=Helicocarpus griseus UAMH5409 TaxID=1447875 RepID=A0A2B7WGL7_9EURO|nr:hypothetical protein AJ79_09822 [Helicocarpus griseus UAMH5409]
MTNMDISAIVSSIISAFGNGRDLFKSMQKKQEFKRRKSDKPKRDHRTHGSRKKKRRNTNEAVRDDHIDDLRIQASLERGPTEIKGEYEKSVRRIGERFKKGDELAQTSLAHTLLVLNAGLMKLIAACLSNDEPGYNCTGTVERRSLLTLSDSAAADAVVALDELRQRLLNASTPDPYPTMTPSNQKGIRRSRSVSRRRSNKEPERNSPSDKKRPQSATKPASGARGQKNIIAAPPKPPMKTETSNQGFKGMLIRSKRGSSISLATTAVGSHHPAQQVPKKLTNTVKQCDMEHNQGHPAFAHLQQPSRLSSSGIDFRQYGRLEFERRGQPPPSIRTTLVNDRRVPAPAMSKVLREDMQPLSPLVPLQHPRGRTIFGGDTGAPTPASVSSGSTKLGEIPDRGRFTQPMQPPQQSPWTGPVVELGYQRPRVAMNAGVKYWRKLAKEATDVNTRKGLQRA